MKKDEEEKGVAFALHQWKSKENAPHPIIAVHFDCEKTDSESSEAVFFLLHKLHLQFH